MALQNADKRFFRSEQNGHCIQQVTDAPGISAIFSQTKYGHFWHENQGYPFPTDPCWCLLYGSPRRPLEEVAVELNLRDGMPVILYYEDPLEEFEVSEELLKRETVASQWRACADWSSRRRIK
jgi:hypothetical protein